MKLTALSSALAAVPGAPAVLPAPTLPSTSSRRLKLWDLEEKYHCPVIGTCVQLEELVRFAKRFDFSSELHDEFALHVEAVNHSLERNVFSEALQKHLERKYALAVKQFSAARSDQEVLALWRECLSRGEVAAPVWATLTHKHASSATRHFVYADIHMLSHQVGAGQAADARRLAFLEKENVEQRHRVLAERRDTERREAALARRVEDLETKLARLAKAEQETSGLRARLIRYEEGSVVVEMGHRLAELERANQRLLAESRRVWELEKTLAATRTEATRFAAERDQLGAECDALERMLLAGENCDGECTAGCAPATDTEGEPRSVLCVGGRTALVAQYRALAQRIGIRLVHHDGGQEEALSRLPDMIAGADAVMCPTDCVNHAAYYQLKRHCKRSGKPCLLFRGASVSGFAVALARLAAGQVSIAGAANGAPA
ncbi:MAG: hypothetical protein A2045_03145 [Rhodocyclales bacterium GWA2_65_20]|nr:MAG: hypothetical protein A2045_03145 [Rhodocyclales bacterium GWA2_65_20]